MVLLDISLKCLLPLVVWLGLLLLYLGRLVTSHMDQPPSPVLPRLLFMLAVAVLVKRRAGRPSSLRQPTSLLYEIFLTILVCNLALTLVWDQVETMVRFLLTPTVYAVESLTSISLTCPHCKGMEMLYQMATLVLAAALLFWVLCSVTSLPFLQRAVMDYICDAAASVRFHSRVEVRFINPQNHSPERPTSEDLKAPTGCGRNPVVQQSQFQLNIDGDAN